ncbi:MAG: hypothetical protein ABIH70_06185 [Chloroflexota bacterium]
MPAKPQHGKRKHLPKGKRRKGLSQAPAIGEQSVEEQAPKVVSGTVAPVASARPAVTTTRAHARVVEEPKIRDPYVRTELRNIAILASAMVILIVVLALVLT